MYSYQPSIFMNTAGRFCTAFCFYGCIFACKSSVYE